MIVYKRTNSDNTDFKMLVFELDRYLATINGEANDFFAQYNKIDSIQNVIVAYSNDKAVGCGAMKKYEKDVMEIKRMFVPVEERGKGIATNILNELQIWTKELGYHKCILETSDKMPDAINLYKKNHYRIIPNYGQYTDVISSVCFEKEL